MLTQIRDEWLRNFLVESSLDRYTEIRTEIRQLLNAVDDLHDDVTNDRDLARPLREIRMILDRIERDGKRP